MKQRDFCTAYRELEAYINKVPASEKGSAQYIQARHHLFSALHAMPDQLDKWYQQAAKALNKHDTRQADSLFQIYLANCTSSESRHTDQYTQVLVHHAMALQRKGQIQACIGQLKQAIDIRRNTPAIDKAQVAEAQNLLASVYHQNGEYAEAIATGEEALNIYQDKYGKRHHYYGTTLTNLASYYASRDSTGDIQQAIRLAEQAEKSLDKGTPEYAQALNSLVVFYSQTGDFVKANSIAKNARKISRKQLGEGTLNAAAVMANQSVRLAHAGNHAQAVEYAREAIDIFQAQGEISTLRYAKLLSNTAAFEKQAERYAEAIELWQKAAPIFKNIEGEQGSGYLNCISEISAAHARLGNLEQSADLSSQLQASATEGTRQGDARFANALQRRATGMAADGNFAQAILLQQQALSIYRQRADRLHEAQALKELASYLFHTGQQQMAIDSCQAALCIYKQEANQAEAQALTLNDLSIYEFSTGQPAAALRHGKEALHLYVQNGNTGSSLYAKVLTNLALYLAQNDSLRQAVALSREALNLQSSILGEEHPDNVMTRYNLANYLLRMGDHAGAQEAFHKALQMQMKLVRSNFSHLTTRGRELYWGTKNYIFHAAPAIACLMPEQDEALTDAFNVQLFTKGLLLNSEIDFHNLLAHTASAQLQAQYEQLTSIRQQIEQTWRSPSNDGHANVSSLLAQATLLERAVVRGCKEYGDFTANMSVTYQDVAQSLTNTEAAIEFFDIDVEHDGRTYWALLARKGWDSPRLVRLFSHRDIADLRFKGHPLAEALTVAEGVNAIFADDRLGALVWQPLLPLLEGVNDVWFSPSGLFYQWGIEYLRLQGQRIDNRFNLHRLSSTKLLVQRNDHKRPHIDNAVVYGGLEFDASATQLMAANAAYADSAPASYLAAPDAQAQQDMAMAETRALDGFARGERGSVSFLPGTLNEAETINGCLEAQGIHVQMRTGAAGTEESFKALNGKRVPLLHIATHGFSLDEAMVHQHRQAKAYLDVAQDEAAQADNSLCYSGLLMAGANQVLSGKTLPSGLENGVLTAREIAAVDLRGLDLIVLSACQTGLGELKEDGVFGLQRGFKKAGAKTLLMSLWSVDDEATQIMMTAFYHTLFTTEGATVSSAFRTALQTLRDNGFDAPYYWASFVLLDE